MRRVKQQRETERDDSEKGMHAKMRVPRRDESLSWGKQRGQSMLVKDAGVISSALSSLKKFSNDGSFLHQFKGSQNDDSSSTDGGDRRDSKSEEPLSRTDGGDRIEVSKSEEPSSRADMKPALSANQLAAKVMQLRMKGKHAEADKLLRILLSTTLQFYIWFSYIHSNFIVFEFVLIYI